MPSLEPKYGGDTISATYPPKEPTPKFNWADGSGYNSGSAQEPLSDVSKNSIADFNAGLQQTTTEQRNVTAGRMNDLATITDQQREDYLAREPERIRKLFGLDENGNKISDKTSETVTTTGGETNQTDTVTPQPTAIEISIKNIEDQALADAENAQSAFDKLQGKMDTQYQAMIRATKDVYNDRIKEMKEANKRVLQTKETVGIRAGRQRYTPVMQDGLLMQEEIEGVQRVTTIANQLNAALAAAADAKLENDVKAFNSAYDRIDQIKKDAKSTITKLYEAANTEYKNMLDAKKEERIATKEALDLEITKADQTAPAIAAKIGELSTPEQQADFIGKMAENLGIDANILLGSVYDSMQEADKIAMDIKNIESQIGVRWSSENRQQDKYTQEQQDRQDKDTLRLNIVRKLDSGEITIEQARTAWGMVFSLDEFEKEFTGYIDEL